MLFSAKVKVKLSYYESVDKIEENFHIIEAEDESDACYKIERYYDLKDVSFYVSHTVEVLQICGLIF